LRRRSRGLLGGRAIEQHLFPLTSREVPGLNLLRLCNHGGLPAHYLVDDPAPLKRAYVNAYLKQEIIDESATRNVPAFTRFLQVVGLTHSQQLNYANVARETGVSAGTVRSYFQILEDTLLGFTLEPWRRRGRRRLVETAKFYLFDIGIANALHPETTQVAEGSDVFGRAFEQFVLNEVRARISYADLDAALSFWRTHSGHEVDVIVGDLQVAVECKSSRRLRTSDLKGMRALMEEHSVGRAIVVCREAEPRRTEDGIDILPWRVFCDRLWAGDFEGIG
jgi:predicted AAA+ superfamily ATPase